MREKLTSYKRGNVSKQGNSGLKHMDVHKLFVAQWEHVLVLLFTEPMLVYLGTQNNCYHGQWNYSWDSERKTLNKSQYFLSTM